MGSADHASASALLTGRLVLVLAPRCWMAALSQARAACVPAAMVMPGGGQRPQQRGCPAHGQAAGLLAAATAADLKAGAPAAGTAAGMQRSVQQSWFGRQACSRRVTCPICSPAAHGHLPPARPARPTSSSVSNMPSCNILFWCVNCARHLRQQRHARYVDLLVQHLGDNLACPASQHRYGAPCAADSLPLTCQSACGTRRGSARCAW